MSSCASCECGLPILGMVIAAGLNNDFLVNSMSHLAIRYNDRCPLENHHAAAGFTALLMPEYNFLASMPRSDFVRMRKVGAQQVQ